MFRLCYVAIKKNQDFLILKNGIKFYILINEIFEGYFPGFYELLRSSEGTSAGALT